MSADPTSHRPGAAGPVAGPSARADDTLDRQVWPAARTPWDRPAGLAEARALGTRLRRLHERPAANGARRWSTARATAPAVRRLVADGLLATRTAERLDAWATALDETDRAAPTLGGLGLDRVDCSDGPPRLPEPTGALAAPALDVGWAAGDLLRHVHLARATGRDPDPLRRLLAALWTGYAGADPGATPHRAVRRAAVLRVALRAAAPGGPAPGRATERALEAGLVAVLADRV